MSKRHHTKQKLNTFEKSYIAHNQDWHIRLDES